MKLKDLQKRYFKTLTQKASANNTGFVCLFQSAAQNSAVSSFIEVFSSLKCVVSCRSHV